MGLPVIEIYESKAIPGEWRWRVIAGNGEIIASGEGYASKQAVVNGVDALRRAVALAGNVYK